MACLRTIPVLVALLTSCASFNLGMELGRNEGRTMNAATEEGAGFLQALYSADGGARDVQAEYGDPDYVRIEDTSHFYFFYVDRDAVVVLERGGMRVNSAVSALSPIPKNFMARLGLATRAKIEQSRSIPARSAAE